MRYSNGTREDATLNAGNFRPMFEKFLDALRVIEHDPDFVAFRRMLFRVGKYGSAS